MSDSAERLSSRATQVAAKQFTRRTLLKSAAAGAVAAAGPWYVKRPLASSGELRIFAWAGYFTDEVLASFQDATGIKPVYVPFATNDEQLNQLRASGGEGFDIIMPTVDRAPNYVEQGFIQPLDEGRIEMDRILASAIKGSAENGGVQQGSRYFAPTHWGTEALCFDRKAAPLSYGASLGDLWKPEYKGQVTLRGHSGLAGIGRWLDAQGKLPHPFVQSYKDEAAMRANWDEILKVAIANKPSVGQFWSSANEALGAFQANGCTIGLNWDETAVALQGQGLDYGYIAPAEGAFAWMEGYCLLKGAKNTEQAYAWINHFLKPEVGAAFAASKGTNSVAKGAEEHLPEQARAFFAEAFPGDALEKLWWWPVQDSWYVSLRNEYTDRYLAA
jgi:spermidine/putrescine transport system substrate-binding protein